MTILYAEPHMEPELAQADPLLRLVVEELAAVADRHWRTSITVVCVARPGDSGPHGATPCRGADVRCRDWPAEAIRAALDHLNGGRYDWPLDSRTLRPMRATCLYELPAGQPMRLPELAQWATRNTRASAEHLHLQVPSERLRREHPHWRLWVPTLSRATAPDAAYQLV